MPTVATLLLPLPSLVATTPARMVSVTAVWTAVALHAMMGPMPAVDPGTRVTTVAHPVDVVCATVKDETLLVDGPVIEKYTHVVASCVGVAGTTMITGRWVEGEGVGVGGIDGVTDTDAGNDLDAVVEPADNALPVLLGLGLRAGLALGALDAEKLDVTDGVGGMDRYGVGVGEGDDDATIGSAGSACVTHVSVVWGKPMSVALVACAVVSVALESVPPPGRDGATVRGSHRLMVHVANHASIDAAFTNSVARYTPDTEVQPEVRSHRLPFDGTARPLSVRSRSPVVTSGR